MIKISGVRPLADHKLWLRFSTGEVRLFDFKPLLKSSVFAPLSDESMFRQVYHCVGEIEIPEAREIPAVMTSVHTRQGVDVVYYPKTKSA